MIYRNTEQTKKAHLPPVQAIDGPYAYEYSNFYFSVNNSFKLNT